MEAQLSISVIGAESRGVPLMRHYPHRLIIFVCFLSPTRARPIFFSSLLSCPVPASSYVFLVGLYSLCLCQE